MIRRVMLAPLAPQAFYPQAFKNVFGAAHVAEFDYLGRREAGLSREAVNAEFVAAVKAFAPDWLFMQLQETNVLDAASIMTLRETLPKMVTSHWTGDIRARVPEYLATICKVCHITFISSIGHIPIYKAAGAWTCEYLQIGLDWHEDVLWEPDWTPPFRVPDVVFIGNHYGDAFAGTRDREGALRALRTAGFDVGIVGSGWKASFFPLGACHIKRSAQVYRRAKVALSVNHFHDTEGYWSDRHIMAMASATPLVAKYTPGLEKEFVNGEELFWFTSEDEMVDQVLRLLSDPSLRARVGQAGRAKAIRSHSWYSRVLEAYAVADKIGRTL